MLSYVDEWVQTQCLPSWCVRLCSRYIDPPPLDCFFLIIWSDVQTFYYSQTSCSLALVNWWTIYLYKCLFLYVGRIKTTLTPQAFRTAYSKNVFYQKDYTLTYVGNEIAVTESNNQQDWKSYFIHKKCFGPNYFFGAGLDTNADMVRHCRVIMFHFEDSNMDAYVVSVSTWL